ncbi:PilW family protein [Roseateles sp.]|uniref:PilW family protein n=1 Tax=Roseateles sp. TaxID=1971397 RepID=UPI003BA75851
MRLVEAQLSQRGLSLVGLMVGMVISLVAVLGALALYRSSSQTLFGDGGLVLSAKQDAQLASGLLSAQIALQEAGYGITTPSPTTHFVLLSNALFDVNTLKLSGSKLSLGSTATQGNAVLWAANRGLSNYTTDYRCAGLLVDSSSRAFYLLQSTGACSTISTQWSAITWQRSTLVAHDLLTQAIGLSARVSSNCWPLGTVPQTISKIQAQAGDLQVRLSYGGSVAGSDNTYSSCLVNYVGSLSFGAVASL